MNLYKEKLKSLEESLSISIDIKPIDEFFGENNIIIKGWEK